MNETIGREPTLIEKRVEHIADLMARGLYVTRITAKQLAAEWGLSKTTIEHYAGEASRRVRADRGSLDQVRDGQLSKLELIVMQAIAKKEFRTAVAAIEAAAKIGGTMAPQKHEITGVLLSAAWAELRTRIMTILEPYPEARAALIAELGSPADSKPSAPAAYTPAVDIVAKQLLPAPEPAGDSNHMESSQ
jgi:hypothetical protein